MELAAARVAPIDGFLEAIRPVDTQQADHREHDSDTQTGRTAHVEGVEILHIAPSITSFKEGKGVHLGTRFEHQGVTQLERHAAVGVGRVVVGSGQTSVLITAEADGLGGVTGTVARHAVTTDVIGLERGLLVLVVGAEQAKLDARHEHRTFVFAGQGGVGAELEFPLVVLNPAVLLLSLAPIGRTVIVVG